MSRHEASTIGVLMPKISNPEMFSTRYRGLERELGLLGVTAAFAFTHASYIPEEHSLTGLCDTSQRSLYAAQGIDVVRDLTIPSSYDQPIYLDDKAPKLVHPPALNRLLRRKDEVYELLPEVHPLTIVTSAAEVEEAAAAIPGYRVIIKPLTGAGAKDVRMVRKKDLRHATLEGDFLVQQFVDTSKGDPHLGIVGTHNLRVVSIDSEIVGAVARVGGKMKSILKADGHGEVFQPERLPEEVSAISDTVHAKLKEMPGSGRNVIAIDMMYGKSKGEEDRYVVCELNHRPVRISPWDLRRDDTQDPEGMLWLGRQWDKEEARMLAGISEGIERR